MNEATLRQIEAARPDASTWLSANAGSGKTRVLTDRVARLLLGGTPPQNILCLTFTKAAAGEMQNRLFARLGAWAMKPDAALAAELAAIGVPEGIGPDRPERGRMHRDAGDRQVVVADRLHAHHGEKPADGEQLLGFSQPDRAVTFLGNPVEIAQGFEPGFERGVLVHGLAVDVANELHKDAVERHLLTVHFRHGPAEPGADFALGDEGGHGLSPIGAKAGIRPGDPRTPIPPRPAAGGRRSRGDCGRA